MYLVVPYICFAKETHGKFNSFFFLLLSKLLSDFAHFLGVAKWIGHWAPDQVILVQEVGCVIVLCSYKDS